MAAWSSPQCKCSLVLGAVALCFRREPLDLSHPFVYTMAPSSGVILLAQDDDDAEAAEKRLTYRRSRPALTRSLG